MHNTEPTHPMSITFEEAQVEFQRIVRTITATSTPAELNRAQAALDGLTDQLRGKDGFESLRSAIDAVYDDLVDNITAGVLKNLQSRDDIFKHASASFAAIQREAEQSARLLTLEKTKLVLPALNQSVGEVKSLIAALQSNNVSDAVTQGESLLALIEKIKAEVS